MTQHRIAWDQNSSHWYSIVGYKCSCCEADGTQWKRTRNLSMKKASVRSSSLTDAGINFFEQGNTDLCEL